MEEVYLVTGATGFLGREVAKQLTTQQKKVIGKTCTLKKFFEQAEGKMAILIHCAGLVSVASEEERMWNVNVDGTRNIVDLCEKYHIHKLEGGNAITI